MHGGCRVNPASLLATVGTSNARYVSRVREATECGRARRLAVAVGDFHTAQPLPDSLPRSRSPTLGSCPSSWLLHKPLRYPVRCDEVQRVDFPGGQMSRENLSIAARRPCTASRNKSRDARLEILQRPHLCATASVRSGSRAGQRTDCRG